MILPGGIKMSRVTETRTVEEDNDRAADRPATTNQPDEPSGSTLAERAIYIIGGVLLSLLGLRVLLSLLGANPENTFANFIYTISYPFVAPFFGLFNYEVQEGVARLEIETLVAMVIYGLLIILLVKLASIGRPDRTET